MERDRPRVASPPRSALHSRHTSPSLRGLPAGFAPIPLSSLPSSFPQYPESELEHSHSRSHSRSPSLGQLPQPVSVLHTADSLTQLINNSPSLTNRALSFSSTTVSLTSVVADIDGRLTSVSSAEVDEEERTRQSMGSASVSPRLSSELLASTSQQNPSNDNSPFRMPVVHSRSGPLPPIITSVNGVALAPLSEHIPAIQNNPTMDPLIANILNLMRQSVTQHEAELSQWTEQSSMPRNSSLSSAMQKCSVELSARLLQLSQRLQEVRHALSKRLIVAVGAAGGQMKACDYEGCVTTCKRAMADIEQWMTLSSMPPKEAMLVAFKSFKRSFTAADAFACRLLYVEFFLTLSALLEKSYPEWSIALSNSAQKGLKASANEAIRSMTKITKLLFTAGLSKPPSAYRASSKTSKTVKSPSLTSMLNAVKQLDGKQIETAQVVRMFGKAASNRDSPSLAVSIDADDWAAVRLALGVDDESNSLSVDGDSQPQSQHSSDDVKSIIASRPAQPVWSVDALLAAIDATSRAANASLPSAQSPRSSAFTTPARVSVEHPSATTLLSSPPRSAANTRHIKFHAGSASPISQSNHSNTSMAQRDQSAPSALNGVTESDSRVQPLLDAMRAKDRVAFFRLLRNVESNHGS